MNKRLALRLFLLVFGAFMYGCEGENNSESIGNTKIKKSRDSYIEAFNQKNMLLFSSLWTEGAIYKNLNTNETIQGKSQIMTHFKNQFDRNNTILEWVVESVEQKNSSKIIEKAVLIFSNVSKPEERRAFEAIYIKKNGHWLIEKLSEVQIVAVP